MYLLVTYDVVSNKRRAKLHKRLAGYLRAVQKSVFEGLLPDAKYAALSAMITETIDHETDTVRVYRLCRGCTDSVALIGTAEPVPKHPEDLIV